MGLSFKLEFSSFNWLSDSFLLLWKTSMNNIIFQISEIFMSRLQKNQDIVQDIVQFSIDHDKYLVMNNMILFMFNFCWLMFPVERKASIYDFNLSTTKSANVDVENIFLKEIIETNVSIDLLNRF